jgi:hypothetical protein
MTGIFDNVLSYVDMDRFMGRYTCIGFCYLFVVCVVLLVTKSTITTVLCYHMQC